MFPFLCFVFFPRSLQMEEPTEKQLEVKDLQYSQFQLSEHHRLMLEACQFAQFKREHPLEKWTVGSLPNLSKCSIEKCYPKHWEIWTVNFKLWTTYWKLECHFRIVNFELWRWYWELWKYSVLISMVVFDEHLSVMIWVWTLASPTINPVNSVINKQWYENTWASHICPRKKNIHH